MNADKQMELTKVSKELDNKHTPMIDIYIVNVNRISTWVSQLAKAK